MLNRMKVGTKLMGGFAAVSLIAMVVGAVGLININEIGSVRVPSLIGLNELDDGMMRIWVAERGLVNHNMMDPQIRQAQYAFIEEAWGMIDQGWKLYEPLPQTPEEAVVWKRFVADFEQWKRLHQEVVELSRARDRVASTGGAPNGEEVAAYDDKAFQASLAARQAILATTERMERLVHINEEVATQSASTGRVAMIAALIISPLVAMLLGFLLTRSITRPVADTVRMIQELGKGHLGGRLHLQREDELGVMARAMDQFAEDLQTVVAGMRQIAEGNLQVEVPVRDSQDEIGPALKQTVESLRGLVAEVNGLNQAAVEGKLAVRADAGRFQGEYRRIVEGLNATLDAVVTPLKVAAANVDRISRGDVPPRITEAYKGDFDELIANLNRCIGAVGALVADSTMLADAAIEGRLDARAQADKHQGDFGRVVSGVNQTLDVLVGVIDKLPAPVMIVDKEMSVQYMNEVGASVGGLTKAEVIGTKCYNHFKTSDCRTDRCACARAIQQGRPASSETDAHPGTLSLEIAYTGSPRKDRNGNVIGALEFVTDQTAIKQAARVIEKQARYQAKEVDKLVTSLDKLAQGDLSIETGLEATDDDTRAIGQNFEQINKSLDASVGAVNALVADAAGLAQAAVEGKLSARADAGRHQGSFRTIIQGVNDTLDAVMAPISEAAQVLESVAAKDLTVRVKGTYRGEHARITESINTAVDNLDEGMGQVGTSANQVSAAAGQISSGSQSLAEGASEQASSLEEISSSLEEMASMTKQNAENSDQAKGLAQGARESAEKGITAMTRMTGAIEKIKTSSDQTAKIVKTIDEIAFQTNLLALNAAVEAARAGEAGKGFAVVAEEVRNLAQRSAEAAKTTADMIESSVKNAEDGVKVTEEVAATLGEITEGARKVNELIAEIAAASKEQSQGIEQVNVAVSQLDKVTQQNAANAEESASAAEELNGQSEELRALLATYALSERGQAPAAAPPPVHHVAHALSAAPHAAAATARPMRKGRGRTMAVAAKGGNGQQPDPAAVIPLDDDEDLKSF